MAERRAMASGFSLSEMGSEGGCCLKAVGGGGALRGRGSERSMGASWATVAVGVMGETGGRSDVGDSERFCECAEVDEAPLDDAGRRLVSTSSAGMAAGGGGLVEARCPRVLQGGSVRWATATATSTRLAPLRGAAATRRAGRTEA
jgi:hypothetical protein